MVIKRVSDCDDFAATAALANEIWTEYYTPLIGAEQVAYMVTRFQSEAAIKTAVEQEGYLYYLARDNGRAVAYCGVLPESGGIFLSKLYVHKDYRGRGIAHGLLDTVLNEHPGTARVRLTVNKGNTSSIAAYLKMGFVIAEEVVADIGGGFVMDDYKMVLTL